MAVASGMSEPIQPHKQAGAIPQQQPQTIPMLDPHTEESSFLLPREAEPRPGASEATLARRRNQGACPSGDCAEQSGRARRRGAGSQRRGSGLLGRASRATCLCAGFLAIASTLTTLGCQARRPPLATSDVKAKAGGYVVTLDPDEPPLSALRFLRACTAQQPRPASARSDAGALAAFVRARGLTAEAVRVEEHLELVTLLVPGFNHFKLRVAEFKDRVEAGAELERALLERQPGTWGLHRGNLAALAPQAAPHQDIITLAAETHLACWATLMIRAEEEVMVIGGGYASL